MPDLKELLLLSPNIAMLIVLVIGALRFAPYWKDVKMREFDVREAEVASRQKQAEATITQAESLVKISVVVEKAVTGQQQTTEINDEMRMFLRAAMREHESIAKRLGLVEKRFDGKKKNGLTAGGEDEEIG